MSTSWNDLENVQTFDYPEKSEKAQGRNLLVVDGINLGFRWKHSMYRLLNKNVDPESLEPLEGFSEEYISTISSLAQSYSSEYIILAVDGKNSAKFRKSFFPEYKGNRDLIKLEQTPAEQKMFSFFWEDLKKAIEEAGMLKNVFVLEFEGVEADDIAAYIVDNAPEDFDNIWLVSSDKDWDQLVCDNVSRFNWATQKNWKNVDKSGPRPKEITTENWSEHHIAPREHYLLVRSLEGDAGDNIDGIKGIGPKRAAAIAKKYETVDNLLENIPLPGKAKYIQSVNDNKDIIDRNATLINLRFNIEEAIGEENMEEIDKVIFSIQ